MQGASLTVALPLLKDITYTTKWTLHLEKGGLHIRSDTKALARHKCSSGDKKRQFWGKMLYHSLCQHYKAFPRMVKNGNCYNNS